mmetsp:Transcript_3950/g.8445  ORF Transcript_3950/g.8445 Transcript_3950/m.8445 type:complete len:489 (+) Transcript_3950:156-1622(+)|eukprot:CAMPEP_0171531104 /NCGR_PEP_ID=MMETSP0959-20130129/13660_1 /TAXON_ID=87120 /ORGANISM="Aurantiochytrium limacinum, Strain ATCCMYA-1381" /LENGTH=488 /DNA_ID=CAMNT_0012074395 /DNA_START=57 /DNA_END=1523 /DNA_ORIENTATION=+
MAAPVRQCAAQLLGLPTKQLILAPMVDASELAFRALCRKYGTRICWTPMLHSRLFCENEVYRAEKFTTDAADRPLVVQFCGHDKDVLLEAAKMVEAQCDMIDLNLGCPQDIARRGRYGAFLMEEVELLEEIVSHLSKNLKVPVSCKIRIFPELERTLDLARRLEASGASLITVHGRTKEQNKEGRGHSDWQVIRKVKDSVKIPVIANGSIGVRSDIQRCLDASNADGVMSAEAILENPALGLPEGETMPEPTQLAREYLDFAEKYNEGCKITRAHLFKILHGIFDVHKDFRLAFAERSSSEGWLPFYRTMLDKVEAMHGENGSCKEVRCRTQQSGYGPGYDRHLHRNPDLYEKDPKTGELVVTGVPSDAKGEVLIDRAVRRLRKRHGKLRGQVGWLRRRCKTGQATKEDLEKFEADVAALEEALASGLKGLETLDAKSPNLEDEIARATHAYDVIASQEVGRKHVPTLRGRAAINPDGRDSKKQKMDS